MGFEDWKNANIRIISHEKSKEHLAALSCMLNLQNTKRIDSELQQENERMLSYWQ